MNDPRSVPWPEYLAACRADAGRNDAYQRAARRVIRRHAQLRAAIDRREEIALAVLDAIYRAKSETLRVKPDGRPDGE